MRRKSILVFLLIAIVLSAAVFQLVDPSLADSNASKEVDFSDSPSEIVSATVTNLDRTDHTYTVVVSSNRSKTGEEDVVKRLKVENSDQKYVAYGPLGKNGTKVYGNDAVAWVWSPNDGEWHLNTRVRYAYPAENDLNPIDTAAIARTEGTVVNETSTRVVIRINSSTLKETDLEGYTLFHVDKRTERIRKVVEVHRDSGNVSYKIARFSNVESTTVERPNGIGFSPMESIIDLARYNPK